MRPAFIQQGRCPARLQASENGSIRTPLLVLLSFCVGLAVSAFLVWPRAKSATPAEAPRELSVATKSVLAHLDRTIEIHFYALLDPNAPNTLRSFSGRVARLLTSYQQQANGKIAVAQSDSQNNSDPNAAIADGIREFDLDKGEGCYLGLSLSGNGKKEVLARLSPEWEPALEADISRAIERLAETSSSAKAVPGRAPPDSASIAEVQQIIPDTASVSLEEGTRILKTTSLKEFTAAVNEMQAQVREAQARLEQAQKGASPAEQDSALKHLQEVQTGQALKLKEIAAKSQAQIDALKQLKSSGR